MTDRLDRLLPVLIVAGGLIGIWLGATIFAWIS
jgi:hypothetical protein